MSEHWAGGERWASFDSFSFEGHFLAIFMQP
jgi:hypothetical protein